jgi:uncharacterized protein (DUF362 family)
VAENRITFNRRVFLPLAGGALAAGCGSPEATSGPSGNSAVFVGKAASYSVEIEAVIEAGIHACGLLVKGKNVLLKPNLVEFDAATAINTNAAVIAAAVGVFRKLGAATVRIGEGPGHRRDTLYLADEARYLEAMPSFENLFVDLNRDDVSVVKNFADKPEIYLPNTALGADLIVSLAKMKTHHWAGATLSMKNYFGLVPGAIYGWPKNFLHHVGIPRSIAELNRIFSRSFAIVDGIVGMEGNGPIQGTPKPCGVLVMGSDLVAVDATCCRIMGIDADKIEYLRLARGRGHVDEVRIEQRGESIAAVRNPFALIEEFRHVRLA